MTFNPDLVTFFFLALPFPVEFTQYFGHNEQIMTVCWYVLRSKPRKERALYRFVSSEGVECFYPRIRVNPVNPRARKIKPYFPGYMFVHTDLKEVGQSMFRWMPHSLGLVRFGGEPAPVPANLVQGIKRTTRKISKAGGETLYGLERGDEVFIEGGPFEGYRAVFDTRLSGKDRVRVLLTMLQETRKLPVELDAGQIRKE